MTIRNTTRLRTLLQGAALLAGLLSSLQLSAQFQDPTPEELKMTADPKAPGAAAVYLYREETTDISRNVRTVYARLKVLTEKGKELATVKTLFVRDVTKVEKVQARTIHADGTVIPLDVKPEDLLDFKSKYFQADSLVFTLPSVEVGSILEYRLQVHFSYGTPAPRWELQTPYFIHKEHFFFDPNGLIGEWHDEHGKTLDRLQGMITPRKAPVSFQRDRDRFILDLTDVPPLPDEDWMPPINTIRWRAEFYYTYAHDAKEFWDTELKLWAKDTDEFAHTSGTIKKAAASLVSPDETDEQKARKIYAAVMKLDNTDFSRVKSEAERKKEKLKEIHSVDDVWKNQSGAGNSMALLYVALARAAGLKVWPMQVVDRSNAIFDSTYLTTGQLEDYIAIVNLGGKEFFLDPAQKGCPFGDLHWTHSLVGGFREAEQGPQIAVTPASAYTTNVVARSADLTVDPDGNVSGTARIVLDGAEALYWRQQSFRNDPEELKKQFEESINGDLLDGVEATFDHFLGVDDFESKLMAIVSLRGAIGMATGKRMILPGLFFETRAKHPFVSQDKRATPIDVHYPRMETDHVIYRFPPGYAVESLPKTADITWTGSAMLRIRSAYHGDSLEVGRALARNFTLLAPEDYSNLHDFYLKVAAADQQQIVLKREAAPKGN